MGSECFSSFRCGYSLAYVVHAVFRPLRDYMSALDMSQIEKGFFANYKTQRHTFPEGEIWNVGKHNR